MRLEREALRHPLARRLPVQRAQVRVVEIAPRSPPPEPPGPGLTTSRPVTSILDQLRVAADPGGDHRQAGGHGLQDGVGHALRDRRQRRRCPGPRARRVRRGAPRAAAPGRRCPAPAPSRPQVLPARAVARDQQHRAGVLGGRTRANARSRPAWSFTGSSRPTVPTIIGVERQPSAPRASRRSPCAEPREVHPVVDRHDLRGPGCRPSSTSQRCRSRDTVTNWLTSGREQPPDPVAPRVPALGVPRPRARARRGPAPAPRPAARPAWRRTRPVPGVHDRRAAAARRRRDAAARTRPGRGPAACPRVNTSTPAGTRARSGPAPSSCRR